MENCEKKQDFELETRTIIARIHSTRLNESFLRLFPPPNYALMESKQASYEQTSLLLSIPIISYVLN